MFHCNKEAASATLISQVSAGSKAACPAAWLIQPAQQPWLTQPATPRHSGTAWLAVDLQQQARLAWLLGYDTA